MGRKKFVPVHRNGDHQGHILCPMKPHGNYCNVGDPMTLIPMYPHLDYSCCVTVVAEISQ